jgi:uncharacterized HAD superfamily protein
MRDLCVCDIDGVLCNFDKAFDNYIRGFIPDLEPPVQTEWDFRNRYPTCKPGTIDKFFVDFTDEGLFYYADPYPDIQKVSILNPTIITTRPKESAKDTYAWLIKHKIKFNKVILTEDKSKFINVTKVIFEDKCKNILPFADAGVQCFLFDHPYNRNTNHENITRVSGWSEVNFDSLEKN